MSKELAETVAAVRQALAKATPRPWDDYGNGIIYGPDDGYADQIVDGSCGRAEDRALIVTLVNAAEALLAAVEGAQSPFDFRAHLQRQREWSGQTFGPGDRAKGVVDHIRKELREIEAKPQDLSEWIDVAILALDGAWRAGYSPDQIIAALVAKQVKNEARVWPDWRTLPTDRAIEHDRSADAAAAGTRREGEAQPSQDDDDPWTQDWKYARAGMEAARTVLRGFDEGVFVRSTGGDADPVWAIKLFPFLSALAALQRFADGDGARQEEGAKG